MNYDRMNPEWNELKKRLQEYSSIDYGAPAYPLSTAEAKMIVTMVITPKEARKLLGFED